MKPEVVLVANVGNLVYWVKGSENRRSARDVHEERHFVTRTLCFSNLLLEVLRNHTSAEN